MNTITLQLTDKEVDDLRAEIDRIPLSWAPLIITKLLTKLPFTEFATSDGNGADRAGTAPTLPQESVPHVTSSKIVTCYNPPPIPMRKADWTAWDEDGDESGPLGTGATEAEAIADLKEKLEEV